MCRLGITNSGLSFGRMSIIGAEDAAKEIGFVYDSRLFVKNNGRESLWSISFFDQNDDEIAYYLVDMEVFHVNDPPRKTDQRYRIDRTV